MPSHLPQPGSLNNHGWFEISFSASIVIFAMAFFAYVLITTGTGRLESYDMTATLPTADGLVMGADVRVGGVKVGSITRLDLDRGAYMAVVGMRIRDDLLLPADSMASVTVPMAGSAYLSISPGHGTVMIPAGGTIGQRDNLHRAKRAKTIS
jgi:phospholipid/cholesterol/gamma-HCH transport system substrate-binding protein